MSEADLARQVELVQAGDPEAWGEIYRVVAPRIFRLCRRALPRREDAEDATAEIFLKARVRLDQYDPSRPFLPWLYRVAANHCWDELRKRRGRGESAGEPETLGLEAEEAGPQERLLATESRERIRAALGALPDRTRMALVMRYFAELSYEEIGQELGVTPSFVGVLLMRGRRRLRRILARERS